jgi:6-phosphogluconate dehydrogenase
MQIGLIGLGKMGHNLALNFKKNDFSVIAFDGNKAAMEKMAAQGITTTKSVGEVAQAITDEKRIVWLMVPAGSAVDIVINNLKGYLKAGDIIIDGGNSNYKDTVARARDLDKMGIALLDCGTSGGVTGALNGVCTMIGGKKEAFDHCETIFKSISVPSGYLYCGKSGTGHFVKMVHNGIEYGMMQSIAEGMELLHRYDADVNLANVAHLWNHGSVVRSWLMELTQHALAKDKTWSRSKV